MSIEHDFSINYQNQNKTDYSHASIWSLEADKHCILRTNTIRWISATWLSRSSSHLLSGAIYFTCLHKRTDKIKMLQQNGDTTLRLLQQVKMCNCKQHVCMWSQSTFYKVEVSEPAVTIIRPIAKESLPKTERTRSLMYCMLSNTDNQ